MIVTETSWSSSRRAGWSARSATAPVRRLEVGHISSVTRARERARRRPGRQPRSRRAPGEAIRGPRRPPEGTRRVRTPVVRRELEAGAFETRDHIGVQRGGTCPSSPASRTRRAVAVAERERRGPLGGGHPVLRLAIAISPTVTSKTRPPRSAPRTIAAIASSQSNPCRSHRNSGEKRSSASRTLSAARSSTASNAIRSAAASSTNAPWASVNRDNTSSSDPMGRNTCACRPARPPSSAGVDDRIPGRGRASSTSGSRPRDADAGPPWRRLRDPRPFNSMQRPRGPRCCSKARSLVTGVLTRESIAYAAAGPAGAGGRDRPDLVRARDGAHAEVARRLPDPGRCPGDGRERSRAHRVGLGRDRVPVGRLDGFCTRSRSRRRTRSGGTSFTPPGRASAPRSRRAPSRSRRSRRGCSPTCGSTGCDRVARFRRPGRGRSTTGWAWPRHRSSRSRGTSRATSDRTGSASTPCPPAHCGRSPAGDPGIPDTRRWLGRPGPAGVEPDRRDARRGHDRVPPVGPVARDHGRDGPRRRRVPRHGLGPAIEPTMPPASAS